MCIVVVRVLDMPLLSRMPGPDSELVSGVKEPPGTKQEIPEVDSGAIQVITYKTALNVQVPGPLLYPLQSSNSFIQDYGSAFLTTEQVSHLPNRPITFGLEDFAYR